MFPSPKPDCTKSSSYVTFNRLISNKSYIRTCEAQLRYAIVAFISLLGTVLADREDSYVTYDRQHCPKSYIRTFGLPLDLYPDRSSALSLSSSLLRPP
jgi:hypothetical protein